MIRKNPQRMTFARLADSAAHLERARAALKGCAEHGTFAYECHACIAALRGPPVSWTRGETRTWSGGPGNLQNLPRQELEPYLETMGLV